MAENNAKSKEADGGEKKGRLVLILVLVIIGGLIAVYLILCAAVQNESIWGDVTINGVQIGEMTEDEAAAAVQKQFEEDYADAVITVALDGQEYQIAVLPLLEIDATPEIETAYEYGHVAWLASGMEWLRMQLSGGAADDIEVKPTVKSDDEITAAVQSCGVLDYRSLVDTTWEATEASVVIHKGNPGVVADEAQLIPLVKEALENLNFTETIECPYTVADVAAPDFQAIADSVYKEPTNATLDPDNDYAVVASTNGVSLDVTYATEAYNMAENGTDVEIALNVVEPEITTEEYQANLFSTLLGTYTSTASGSSGRRYNIQLATTFLSNVILLPGETFSFNGTVGETSYERGFVDGDAYENGSVVAEAGGGVCQVPSTIFSAVLQTDLEVVQRVCHSMVVGYVPYGMDATIFWDQPDFQFKNNHSYPIRLNVTDVNNVLTVEIWGTKESDLSVQCRVEQTGDLQYETYRDYYDANGTLVESEHVCSSKYKKRSS